MTLVVAEGGAPAPSVTLTTPAEGASYTYGQSVDASFSCAPGTGATLESCTGTVANGKPINTTSVGSSNKFSVTAKDTDGQTTTVTHTYSVSAPAPTVTTTAATLVAQTTATLNGTVNPNGSMVSACTFEYGTSTSYGKSVSCGSPGAGSSPVLVSAPVTGLSANTTYDFRVVATNGGGTREGSNKTFKTQGSYVDCAEADPSVPSTDYVSMITRTAACGSGSYAWTITPI